MQGRADCVAHPAVSAPDSVARAEALLREVIALLDAAEHRRAAAYADMAREALVEAGWA